MYRENDFEATVKWFLFGAAGIASFLQLIMLFTEFSFYGSLGMLLNGLYHLVGVSCPALIIVIIIKGVDDREVYASYALALLNIASAVIDLCMLVKYIVVTKNTDGLKGWLVLLIVILIGLEVFESIIFVWYGLDKVTSTFVLLVSIFMVFFRGCIISVVDSKFQLFAYKIVTKSLFSVWLFMYLMFYLALVVCLLLYLDYKSLLEVLQNPKELFTKNTLFGTYTNLYVNNNTNSVINTESNNVLKNSTLNSSDQVNLMSGSNVQPDVTNGNKCPLCGNEMVQGQEKCLICGYEINKNV